MAEDREELIRIILETIRQTGIHYGLWFAESVHQLGLEASLEAEREAGKRFAGIVNHKLSKALGVQSVEELFGGLEEGTLCSVAKALSESWLAADGVWFQAIEAERGMHDAKRVNDTAWARFAPLEASRLKDILGLGERSGLDGLKKALAGRMASRVNSWDIVEETADSFVFRLTDCRVQSARKRKGMEDYPCKSGGTVEYTGFARTIDPRIRTECVGCPPDPHPEEWFCAWRFILEP